MSKEADLDREEAEQVDDYSNVPTSVIFEAIRREGEHELSRPASALWWSGVAAGLANQHLGAGQGVPRLDPAPCRLGGGHHQSRLHGRLPDRHPRADAAFNENTITPILPLFLAPTRANFAQTARLWGIVFAANLVGCLAAALVLVKTDRAGEQGV